MSQDQLLNHLSDPNQALKAIRDAPVNRLIENDLKAIDFLVKRIGLLIMMYGQMPEEIFQLVSSPSKRSLFSVQQSIKVDYIAIIRW
ncbi:unnamed protein product [Echinostoma caproni]|uniref:Magnesium transporter n=1 Tax=Echinostoma caproni TaxID=27848 RepID=A0A183B9T1_9TREM|nr:unnamed protein product [Echinostoma caproni]